MPPEEPLRMIGRGEALTLRPIAPEDSHRIRDFIDQMSFGSRYFRFGRGDYRPDDAQVEHLCNPDPAVRRQLVIVSPSPTPSRSDDHEIIVASGRYEVLDEGGCEFAVAALDEWQGLGLGRWLLGQLMQDAREQRISSMVGRVLGTNVRMLAVATRMGFRVDPATDNLPIKRVVASL